MKYFKKLIFIVVCGLVGDVFSKSDYKPKLETQVKKNKENIEVLMINLHALIEENNNLKKRLNFIEDYLMENFS